MVKKLFKHEFLAYTRIMGIVYIILLTVAAAGRVVQLFEDDSLSYSIVSTISFITYGVSIGAALGFTTVLAIVRFYKNLFTAEGYLSFTLPVTPTQHILVKAVTAVTMAVATLVAVLLSVSVITAGEVLVEIWKAVAYLLGKAYEVIGIHTAVIGVELVILLLAALFSGLLLYYTFISIGQLFKKNRILSAVGAYFAWYIFTQIISTIFLVVFSVFASTEAFQGMIQRLGNFVMAHPYVFVHSCIWIVIALTAVFTLVEFLIIRRIITRRLNLE